MLPKTACSILCCNTVRTHFCHKYYIKESRLHERFSFCRITFFFSSLHLCRYSGLSFLSGLSLSSVWLWLVVIWHGHGGVRLCFTICKWTKRRKKDTCCCWLQSATLWIRSHTYIIWKESRFFTQSRRWLVLRA